MAVSPEECARTVFEVVPVVMRTIRADLRRHRTAGLSVPQFRTLAFLARHEGASLSDVAEHIGLTLPSMSKLVDGLVTRGLACRAEDPVDRRRLALCLTEDGQSTLQTARSATQTYLAGLFGELTEDDRDVVAQAMEILRPVFWGDY